MIFISCAYPKGQKSSKRDKRKAKDMLRRLRPLEDWLKEEKAVASVKSVIGDPVEFYEKFKSTLMELAQ